MDKAIKQLKLKLSATDKKKILRAVSWRDENAPPVIKKKHKDGTIEYEPDTDLRDTEQVPLLEDGGIETFFKREVLPFVPAIFISQLRCEHLRRSKPILYRFSRNRKDYWNR